MNQRQSVDFPIAILVNERIFPRVKRLKLNLKFIFATEIIHLRTNQSLQIGMSMNAQRRRPTQQTQR